MRTPLRVGTLGAARITPPALLAPAALRDDVVVDAVAARDPGVARRFADEHGIARVLPSYDALVADPDLDVVYNPLPMHLHGRWTIAALEAGKHVLAEKPFTANAEEAQQVAEVSARTGRFVMEAFHYRYHALTARMLDVVASGELGRLRHVEAFFRARLRDADDIRWSYDLAGGCLMDIGCYPLHLVRTLVGEEPEVVAAEALTRFDEVDRTMRAHLRFPGGVEGRLSSSMLSRRGGGSGAVVVGTHGRMGVTGFVGPQHGCSLEIRSRRGVRRVRVPRTPTSYDGQLAAFVAAVTEGAPVPTGVEDAVAQMRAIDAIYEAAGLRRREPAA